MLCRNICLCTNDPAFEVGDALYLRPGSLAEALSALADGPLTVAAGCTDLLAATERETLPGAVLDITGMPDLRGIARDDRGLRIGATTTWTDIVRADLPPSCRGLQRAAREVGALQIQNRGTLAGNLCNASPAADGMPPLLTLAAEVELASHRGLRTMPLADFVTGPRRTARAADELMTALRIPAAALDGQGHFLKLGARRYLVISIAMVAVRILVVDGVVRQVALAVGSCGPVATRLSDVEAALIGHPPDPARITDDMVAAALSPIGDVRADAAYRGTGAAELLRRAVGEICRQGVQAA